MAKRYFEYKDAKSSKFWEVSVSGKKVNIRYGKIGTAGQSTLKELSSPVEAKAHAEKQAAGKVKKGYKEVAKKAAKKAATKKAATKKTATKKAATKTTKKTATATLSGQTFVVTGTLEDLSRAEAKSAIEALGGKVSGSVSSNTDCVVIGEDPGSKADKAKQLGIKTLNEAGFKRLIGGTAKKATKKKATKKTTKKADTSAKAEPADQQAGKITSAQLRQYVSKIKKLLTKRDYWIIDSGIELARSLDEAAVFKELLKDCAIDKEGYLVRNRLFTGTAPAQPYLDYALISMIAYAPEDCVSAVTLRQSIIRLTMVLSSTKPLAELTNLESLNLSGCNSLQNVDGLANCTKLTSLNLSGCNSLQNVDGLANLTNLTSLDLEFCASLRNVDGLAKLSNLTELRLYISKSLQNVDGLANLTKLTSLDLRECGSLLVSPAIDTMTTREEVAAYQELIKKAMQ